MKIAICFSGQFRTGAWAIPSIKSFIGKLWDNCDFFVHTWDTSYGQNYDENTIRNLSNLMSTHLEFKNTRRKITPIGVEDLNRFLTIYNPKLFLIENFEKVYKTEMDRRRDYFTSMNNFSADIADYTPAALYYSFFRSVELMKYHEDKNKFTYDIVVKLRPDVVFSMNNGPGEHDLAANLTRDITKVLNDPHKFYRSTDVYFISTGEIMKKVSMYWEECIKYTPNISMEQYCEDILDIPLGTVDNCMYTFLRNPFKRIPLEDYYILEAFERFFIGLEPGAIINYDEEYKKHFLEKMKTYIHNYDIIKEVLDEIQY